MTDRAFHGLPRALLVLNLAPHLAVRQDAPRHPLMEVVHGLVRFRLLLLVQGPGEPIPEMPLSPPTRKRIADLPCPFDLVTVQVD
jgi:hypothetical protein